MHNLMSFFSKTWHKKLRWHHRPTLHNIHRGLLLLCLLGLVKGDILLVWNVCTAIYWQNTGKTVLLAHMDVNLHTHTPIKRAMEESPDMLGAELLIGGMWGYPGGPIWEEMLCLESMYMFPVAEQTKGRWRAVSSAHQLSYMHLRFHGTRAALMFTHSPLSISS